MDFYRKQDGFVAVEWKKAGLISQGVDFRGICVFGWDLGASIRTQLF